MAAEFPLGLATVWLAVAEFLLAVRFVAVNFVAAVIVVRSAARIAEPSDDEFAARAPARKASKPAPRKLRMNKGWNAARQKE